MLPKRYRLTKNASYNYIYKRGKPNGTPMLVMYYLQSSKTLIGFSVSNKIGKANVRNLVKRRLRAIMRGFLPKLNTTAQIVFVAKPEIIDATYSQIKYTIQNLLSRSKLYTIQN